MSSRYTSNGKRISSMTHAKHGHDCLICGRRVFGNGGKVAHGRAHVRRGEAVEVVKEYASPDVTPFREFFPPGDPNVGILLDRGCWIES